MAKASVLRKRTLFVLFLAAALAGIATLAGVRPAVAAGVTYAEAPMQVVTKGLTAEQHLRQQAELSRRFLRELPAGALESAVRVPLAAAEIAAIDQAPRWVSPLRIGLVKALSTAVAVAGLDRESLDGRPAGSGLLRRTADGGLAWATVVRADEAGALRLHVEGLALPRNAALYVYSRGGEAYGPYVGAGPDGSGDFWTTAVFGREAILQIRFAGAVTDADLQRVALRVTEVGLITPKFAGDLGGLFPTPFDNDSKAAHGINSAKALWPCGNQSCVLDASCSIAAAASPAKLAMAKQEWVSGSFIFTCTGGLISDTNPSQDNFFLTANHCYSATKTAKNVTFYWRFATAACNSTCPSNTGWPFKTTGATVSASNRKGDFTLVHLNAAPPAGSVFLGWTSAPVANTNGAHLYRVSNPNFGPQVYSQHDVDTAAGTCTGWPRGQSIYSRDIAGAIDGGSSGSPVVNASSQIVGQLSGTCGTASSQVCSSGPGEANATVDGALAFYFATVKPFINP